MEHKTKLEEQIKDELPCCDEPETAVPSLRNISNEKFLGVSMIVAALLIGAAWIYTSAPRSMGPENAKILAALEKVVLPERGVTLPVRWRDLGKRMTETEVIDLKKFEELYAQRGGLDEVTRKLLTETDNDRLIITKDNADTLLNLLWAFGLANKNNILDKGPMTDKKYGGDAGQFASTGGWTLSVGNPMEHYSRHAFVGLTPEQEALVEKVSKNIYRPCCGNSTHFPDCNHGMAMLGLLQLMASQDVSEEEMYRIALGVNSFWFPDTYLNIAQYLKMNGIDWKDTPPRGILAAEYSSAAGYQKIVEQVQPAPRGGGNCEV